MYRRKVKNTTRASIAYLVEHPLSKQEVVGSTTGGYCLYISARACTCTYACNGMYMYISVPAVVPCDLMTDYAVTLGQVAPQRIM